MAIKPERVSGCGFLLHSVSGMKNIRQLFPRSAYYLRAATTLMMNFLGDFFDTVGYAATSASRFMVDNIGHADSIIESATHIFQKAGEHSVRGLIDAVLRRSQTLLSPELLLETLTKLVVRITEQVDKEPVFRLLQDASKCLFKLLSSILDKVNPESLLGIVKELTAATVNAIIAKVGLLRIIREGISSNDVTLTTLGVIWNNCGDLANFLVDLIEPAKCYFPANYIPADSTTETAKEAPPRNAYNELDASVLMNRHAVICQFQRLVKSCVFIVKGMGKTVNIDELEDIGITDATTLGSDVKSDESNITVENPSKEISTNEKWLYVNGIGGELFWLRLACKKLATQYSREVTGIFNRGDGILWDLVECAGERTAQRNGTTREQKKLIQRTKSSRMAQKSLVKELESALKDETQPRHIVMIAHSQGCLLLRLALEEILNGSYETTDTEIRERMAGHLCVFTFGNPSVDWKWEMNEHAIEKLQRDGQDLENLTNLSSHVFLTEHFANKRDFVAKLGVLNDNKPEHSGYAPDSIFINEKEDWAGGHLFGSQYSLDPDDYTTAGGNLNGKSSWLLNCIEGKYKGDVLKHRTPSPM
ncbi:hypothetical protein AnigIFM62618_003448 [Aspergillus niger]|nr:hypothetical protein AnigIFM62618_003448 [Aspergillus niger]